MISKTVRFTDLELDQQELLHGISRKHTGPFPIGWTRHQFEIKNVFDDPLPKIDSWLLKNIDGRWGSYSVSFEAGVRTIVIAFEDVTDAVLFRLKDGETTWRGEGAK